MLLFVGEKLIMLRHKSHFTASISIKLTDPNLYNLFFKRSLGMSYFFVKKEKFVKGVSWGAK